MYGERKKNISQASISCIDGLPRYALCVGRLPRCSEASPICGHRRQHSRCRASSWSPAAWRSPRCAAPPLPRRRRLVEPSLHHASSSGRDRAIGVAGRRSWERERRGSGHSLDHLLAPRPVQDHAHRRPVSSVRAQASELRCSRKAKRHHPWSLNVAAAAASLQARCSDRAFRFAPKLPRSSCFGGLQRLGWARWGLVQVASSIPALGVAMMGGHGSRIPVIELDWEAWLSNSSQR
jgi:hypothetical protein